MKCNCKLFLFALMASAIILVPAGTGFARPQAQQPKAAAQAQDQDQEPDYSDDEYNAWENANKEPDFEKRGTMLLDAIQKYPKTKLMPNLNASYETLLFEVNKAGNYQLLRQLAEKWLKLHPNDISTIKYIAAAAQKTGDDIRCAECLEEIYESEPSGSWAYALLDTYKRLNNQAKYIEWADKIFKMPEYDADFLLRADLVKRYASANNFPEAAKYAQMTLKSADIAEKTKQPDAETKEQLRDVRHVCYHIIGMNYFDRDKFPEAINAFTQAIRYGKYPEGYYYIALSQHKMDKIDEAMVSYACAALMGGDVKDKAKDGLEQVYKAMHNGTTIGIDKIYNKAKEQGCGK
jgi:tetratricopeptide (TPR) repeat protein